MGSSSASNASDPAAPSNESDHPCQDRPSRDERSAGCADPGMAGHVRKPRALGLANPIGALLPAVLVVWARHHQSSVISYSPLVGWTSLLGTAPSPSPRRQHDYDQDRHDREDLCDHGTGPSVLGVGFLDRDPAPSLQAGPFLGSCRAVAIRYTAAAAKHITAAVNAIEPITIHESPADSAVIAPSR